MLNAISTPPAVHTLNGAAVAPWELGEPRLTAEQYAHLIQPLHQSRVGKNPAGYSHMEQWDVRRALIRIFGFGGYDIETLSSELVAQTEHAPGTITQTRWRNNVKTQEPNDRTLWTVVYRAQVRLIIKDRYGRELAHFDDAACGDATNQPSLGDAHDNATKTAHSQALKRAAVNMGDQFGLSLYNGGGGRPDEDGYLRAVVNRSLVAPSMPDAGEPVVIDQAADEPVLPEAGPVSAPPADAAEVYSPPIGGGAQLDEPPAEDYPPAEAPARPAEAAPVAEQPAAVRPAPLRPLPASEPWDHPDTPVAPVAEAPAPPAEQPAAAAAPSKPRPNPEHVFETGVRAIAAAKGAAQLDQLEQLVASFQTDRKITDGQAGRLRLKLGARRDELAAQTPTSSPPTLTGDTEGAIIGAES